MPWFGRTVAILCAVVLVASTSCSRRSRDDGEDTIQITGSDTMVNLTLAWTEAFNEDHPAVSIIIKGGGSGVGIANLVSGRIDLATASRPMKP